MNAKATSDMNYLVESALESNDSALIDQYKNVFENLTEFIEDCSYNTMKCNLTSNFVPVRNSAYGMCFTFNHLLANMSSNMLVTRAGPNFGLRLRLNVHQSMYMHTTDTAGIRVVVHDQHEHPFPETAGYSAKVGTKTSLGLTMIETTRLPSPYGKCMMDKDKQRRVPYFFPGNYTSQGCIYSCLAMRIAQRCGCLHQE
uniref:Amiloride-sensitive sodium channel n=1 Tax=Plectus sambesii TaxID=2011161 RepID=A0A914X2D0_9BILA